MTQYLLHSAVRNFLKLLPEEVKDKVLGSLALLEEFGRRLPPPDSKKITKELFELRIRASIQIRLLYGFSENTIFIVHGFVKKTQKIPRRDLALAERRFRELAS